ncbi:MAG: hypothetical protein Ct9H90mP9_1750 [Pseudomonadota bacterium]|nr:MAG: hypothetical protein Ct9H90mP9_1750 [Pseudomonadota bacterium]
MKGVGDGRSSPTPSPSQECCIDPIPIGKSKTDIDAPQVVLTFNSSRSLRTSCIPGLLRFPWHRSASPEDQQPHRPWNTMILGTFDNFFLPLRNGHPDLRRSPGFIIGNGNHGQLYFLTSGSTDSRRSSSPVTELSKGFPDNFKPLPTQQQRRNQSTVEHP